MTPGEVRIFSLGEKTFNTLGKMYQRLPGLYESKQVLLVDPANCTSIKAVIITRIQ